MLATCGPVTWTVTENGGGTPDSTIFTVNDLTLEPKTIDILSSQITKAVSHDLIFTVSYTNYPTVTATETVTFTLVDNCSDGDTAQTPGTNGALSTAPSSSHSPDDTWS